MKTGIHPTFHQKVKITCSSCGSVYEFGSTNPEMKIEICMNCHPVYTGKKTMIDSAGRIDRFKAKQAKATPRKTKKTTTDETVVE